MMPDHTTPERMKKYTEIKPVVVEGSPDAHTIWLKCGNQRFCLSQYQDTKEEAEWMQDQLCVALDSIVREHAVSKIT